METTVLDLADAAIRFGILGLLITMPPALFLGLGLKRQGRPTILFATAMLFSMALAILGLTVQGLATGEVFALSRSVLWAHRAEDPLFFWLSAAVFGLGALVTLAGAVVVAFRVLVPSNPAFNRTRRKRRAG